MQKAKNYVNIIDREYLKQFGMLPDTHFLQLRLMHSREETASIIQSNVDKVWNSLKQVHYSDGFKTCNESVLFN